MFDFYSKPVLNTADRKPVGLIVCVPVDCSVARIQVSSPRIRPTLQRRPEVGVRRTIVKRPISITVASKNVRCFK